jgi:hypothetical protein
VIASTARTAAPRAPVGHRAHVTTCARWPSGARGGCADGGPRTASGAARSPGGCRAAHRHPARQPRTPRQAPRAAPTHDQRTREGHHRAPGTRAPAHGPLDRTAGRTSVIITLGSDTTAPDRAPHDRPVTLDRTRRPATEHGPGASPQNPCRRVGARSASASAVVPAHCDTNRSPCMPAVRGSRGMCCPPGPTRRQGFAPAGAEVARRAGAAGGALHSRRTRAEASAKTPRERALHPAEPSRALHVDPAGTRP